MLGLIEKLRKKDLIPKKGVPKNLKRAEIKPLIPDPGNAGAGIIRYNRLTLPI